MTRRPRKTGRRFSIWTLAAPIALAAIVVYAWSTITTTKITDDKGSSSEAAAIEAAESAKEADQAERFQKRPKQVRLKAGESLESLGEKYGMTVDEIVAINPKIKDPRVVQLGQVVILRGNAPADE